MHEEMGPKIQTEELTQQFRVNIILFQQEGKVGEDVGLN